MKYKNRYFPHDGITRSICPISIENHKECPKCGNDTTCIKKQDNMGNPRQTWSTAYCTTCFYEGYYNADFNNNWWGCSIYKGMPCFEHEDFSNIDKTEKKFNPEDIKKYEKELENIFKEENK
jgi:hypothetical protein